MQRLQIVLNYTKTLQMYVLCSCETNDRHFLTKISQTEGFRKSFILMKSHKMVELFHRNRKEIWEFRNGQHNMHLVNILEYFSSMMEKFVCKLTLTFLEGKQRQTFRSNQSQLYIRLIRRVDGSTWENIEILNGFKQGKLC